MIIFDASTLILLARAELLDTLIEQSARPMAIPREVERECCEARQSMDSLMIRKAVDAERIRLLHVRDRKTLSRLATDFSLGKGEAEAIALALESRAELIAIDDRQGINACKLLRLRFATAINLLLAMREHQWISQTTAVLKLHALERHGRYRRDILDDARKRLEAMS